MHSNEQARFWKIKETVLLEAKRSDSPGGGGADTQHIHVRGGKSDDFEIYFQKGKSVCLLGNLNLVFKKLVYGNVMIILHDQ